MGLITSFFTGGTTWMWAAVLCFATGGVLGGTGAWKLQAGSIAALKLEHSQAEDAAKEVKRLAERAYQLKKDKANDADVKTRQTIASVDTRVGAELDGLRSALRDSRAANNTLGTCVERADTLEKLFGELGGMAKGLAKAADGHVADKTNCAASWPALK
jgi:hypothetical protein